MELCECGTVDTPNGCPNIHCEYNMCDTCPYCKEMGNLIGDAELLFECENRHIRITHILIFVYINRNLTLAKS